MGLVPRWHALTLGLSRLELTASPQERVRSGLSSIHPYNRAPGFLAALLNPKPIPHPIPETLKIRKSISPKPEP